MTRSTSGTGHRKVSQRVRAIFRGRVPFLLAFGGMLLANWSLAVWLIHYTWQEREATVLQMVNSEADHSEREVADLFTTADRTLLDLRVRQPDAALNAWLEDWTAFQNSTTRNLAGIALIAPDGHVLAASPHANMAGWPHLMTLLATTTADQLVIGDPVVGHNGHLGAIPLARRISAPDGSFAGIIMYSLDSEALPGLSPAITALDGCVALIGDDDLILARMPDLRGTIGVRMPLLVDVPSIQANPNSMGRHVSKIDGIDRIYAYRRMTGIPATLVVGIGHDAAFASWETLRLTVIGARTLASVLILLTIYLWYTRARRAKISSDALTTILAGVEQGIRVESAAGDVIVENTAGTASSLPDVTAPREEIVRSDGAILQVARYDLADGGTVLIGTDVSVRRAAEARINFLTDHDRLTGLPNRWRAVSHIQRLIGETNGADRTSALILLDLDGFQDINDTLGHGGGDEVLIEVAGRLRDLVSGQDVVARLGGDEFMLFLADPDDEAAVMSLARQIPRALARPIAAHGQQVRLGASLGIALCPRDGTDVTTLSRHADIALSRAKMAGRGTAQSFQPAMMVSFEEHRMMESDLRRALDSDELELRLQPQFATDTLEITGFEALTRWRHPTRGELSPAAFIPIAERSGLINPLGLWAIGQACKAAASWRTRHRVAVNLSPSQLRCETIQDDIRAILRRTQFPAHLLELEVTESVLLDEDQRTLETLHKLRAMDIRVTLDDFGTGYSSLSYLRRFPFDKIKIDKSFIQGQGTDRGTRVILEAMIRMCTDLGFDVVAEGVETEHQLAELRHLGCREIQGFLLSEPLLPDMVEDFLTAHSRRFSTGLNQGTVSTPP